MQIKPPQVGQTYASRTDPTMIVYVVDVSIPKGDEATDAAFIVEGCDPAYKDDTANADGCEITSDVWVKHDFALVSK